MMRNLLYKTTLKATYAYLILAISSCQTVPDTKKIIEEAHQENVKIQIQTVNGNFSEKKVEKTIEKIANTDQDELQLKKLLKISQSISDVPLIAGNDTKLLFDGDETFSQMFALMESAKLHINLEYFIFENVQYNNISLEQLLLKKRAENVAINIIYDYFGSKITDSAFLENLKKAGVKITVFNPLDIVNIDDFNHRNHRKILIVDGKAAVVGGVNLSQTYQISGASGNSGASKSPKSAYDAFWRDTDLLVKGPAVAELQKLFLTHWDKNVAIDAASFFPELKPEGAEILRVIGSSPINEKAIFYPVLVAAIENSDKNVTLSSAYFVPTEDQKKVLKKATQNGAKIDLILPGFTDSNLSLNVQMSHYYDLLKHGINIYEVESEVMHAKTITIDGVWSAIGSSNFDYRSATLNDEVDVVVLGSKTAKQLQNKLQEDRQKAKKIDLESWKNRPLIDKLKQYLSRIFQKLL